MFLICITPYRLHPCCPSCLTASSWHALPPGTFMWGFMSGLAAASTTLAPSQWLRRDVSLFELGWHFRCEHAAALLQLCKQGPRPHQPSSYIRDSLGCSVLWCNLAWYSCLKRLRCFAHLPSDALPCDRLGCGYSTPSSPWYVLLLLLMLLQSRRALCYSCSACHCCH